MLEDSVNDVNLGIYVVTIVIIEIHISTTATISQL